jgi:hypothetical protein
MKTKLSKIASFMSKGQKKEEGNYIDWMAGVFIMVLIFAMTLVMMSYGSLVDKRLSINNAIKNYLYIAEQQGGLTQADVNSMKSILQGYGVTVNSVTINGRSDKWIGEAGTSNGNQIPYGDQIDLEVTVTFTNPIYQIVGAKESGETGWFKVGGLNKTITYTKKLSSTSRW